MVEKSVDDVIIHDQVIEENRCCSIDHYTLPAKVVYFFKMAKFVINDYIMLFYIGVGLSPAEAGVVIGLQNFGGMIGAPLFGLLADKLKIHKILFLALGVISLITMFMQPFLAAALGDMSNNTCRINVTETSQSNREIHQSSNHQYLYFSLLVTSIIASTCESNVMSSVDSVVIQIIRSPLARSGYGQQRFVGSIGGAFGAVTTSLSIMFYPESYMSCYTGIFVRYL